MNLPSIKNGDIERFSEALRAALPDASPEQIVNAVIEAARWIEDLTADCPRCSDEIDQVNNATETFCGGARELANRQPSPATTGQGDGP